MIRLQKLLAQSGIGSRRAIEEWIKAGRVTVAGHVARLGDRALPGDDIRLDGRKVDLKGTPAAAEVLLYYKPLGEVTTRRDPQGRPTVFERLPPPQHGRWIVVGRLDVNTSGLLLFTTDGALAHRLMHPSGEFEREYLVRVRGCPAAPVIRRLLEGYTLADGPARFDRVVRADESKPLAGRESRGGGGHTSFRVVLHEGRNREVRRLWEAAGFEVSRLKRISYGPVALPADMRPGMARAADPRVVSRLEAEARRRSLPAGGSPSRDRATLEPGPGGQGRRRRRPGGT